MVLERVDLETTKQYIKAAADYSLAPAVASWGKSFLIRVFHIGTGGGDGKALLLEQLLCQVDEGSFNRTEQAKPAGQETIRLQSPG